MLSAFFSGSVATLLKANSAFGWQMILCSGWSPESCAEIQHCSNPCSVIQTFPSCVTRYLPSRLKIGGGGDGKTKYKP